MRKDSKYRKLEEFAGEVEKGLHDIRHTVINVRCTIEDTNWCAGYVLGDVTHDLDVLMQKAEAFRPKGGRKR